MIENVRTDPIEDVVLRFMDRVRRHHESRYKTENLMPGQVPVSWETVKDDLREEFRRSSDEVERAVREATS